MILASVPNHKLKKKIWGLKRSVWQFNRSWCRQRTWL